MEVKRRRVPGRTAATGQLSTITPTLPFRIQSIKVLGEPVLCTRGTSASFWNKLLMSLIELDEGRVALLKVCTICL